MHNFFPLFQAFALAAMLLHGEAAAVSVNGASGSPQNELITPSSSTQPVVQTAPAPLKKQATQSPEWERALAVQAAQSDRLFKLTGVAGVGIGIGNDGHPAIMVLTETPNVSGIPVTLSGVPVQIVVTGKIEALQAGQIKANLGKGKGNGGGSTGGGTGCTADPTKRFVRPVPIGVSLGHPLITAGTLGARVKNSTGNVFILSNNHVMAAVNLASLGDSELQPGKYDGGSYPNDTLARLSAFKPIVFCNSDGTCPTANRIDAAIAATTADQVGTTTPCGEYTPSSAIATAAPGMAVKKYGRTTRLTTSSIYAVNVSVKVTYGSGLVAYFTGQVYIQSTSFSTGGDSGSLIVKADDNSPVALLFAGSSTSTIGNPIGEVLGNFGVSIDGN